MNDIDNDNDNDNDNVNDNDNDNQRLVSWSLNGENSLIKQHRKLLINSYWLCPGCALNFEDRVNPTQA